VGHAAYRVVGRSTAQGLFRHILLGHRLNNVGTGDKHVTFTVHHHDKIGDGGRVHRPTRAGSHDGRKLRDHAGGQGVSVKNIGVTRQRHHALLDTRPAGVVEAEDGRAAVRLTIELTPDVVVMDIAMPLLDGVEATRQIMEYDPTTRVVVLSADADPQAKVEILGAGASAYLTKQSAYGELARAIRLAMTEPSDPSGPSGPTGPTGPAGRDAI